MLYNETNNFDEIKTLFPDKTEIEVVIRPCLPRADHRVPGGLILRKLMVCFPIIRFFPVLTKLQETFGGCDVFTATRWWEEANQAAAPGRRPTLEWQATWGQSTREKLFRWWFQPFFGNSSKLSPFRFSADYEKAASPSDNLKKALLKVVRQHLTPPPSSTNVERLFSYGGLVATDHR